MNFNDELKVLVIDDSAYNRRTISDIIKEIPEVTSVIKASDGQEGLQMALTEKPAVITLDLEMPRLDGFTFLKLIMSKAPIPVIVISSHSNQENVFRALELGALDFVAKPTHRISKEIMNIKEDIIHKVKIAVNLGASSLHRLPSYTPQYLSESGGFPTLNTDEIVPTSEETKDATRVVLIAASTGGPTALTKILSTLPANLQAAIVVAQHMPPNFTTTFAKRLNKQCALTVIESTETTVLKEGIVYIAPGNKSLEITQPADSFILHTMSPSSKDRYTPSANRLFSSAARHLKQNALAIVLTGMGDDGAQSSLEIVKAGGKVIVESKETSVIDGMPQSVLRLGVRATEDPLDRIPTHIIKFAPPRHLI